MQFTYPKNMLPFGMFCLLFFIAVGLWQHQNMIDRERFMRHAETSAEQIRIRIEGLMNARMAALDLLAARWVERKPPDFRKTRFVQFAEAFFSHYPGFAGINWIDPEGVIQWIFPIQNDTVALGKNITEHRDPQFRETFARVQHDLTFGATPCVELYMGGVGFHVFLPLIHEKRIQGYLDGVFRLKDLMELSLARDILDDFWVRLFEGDNLVYTNREPGENPHSPNGFEVFRLVRFQGKTWKLDLDPRAILYDPSRIHNLPFLIFGVAISVALSLLLYFLIQRMRLYREARDHALYEVSQRKLAQKVLRENEKKLEALVDEIAAKNSELETFVYSVSHDLKTPIVTIEGFVGALREDFGDRFAVESERYLNYISDAARKMEQLIDDLLELSRVGRLKETPSEFSLNDLVEDILAALEPKIREKGIQVHLQEHLPLVYGERKRLIQVMENLISNAVKYLGKENPAPRIDIGCHNQTGEDVFFVRDNGIGIQEQYFEKIFQVFQRLPEAKKIEEGTGVGLTTVKRIIEHHGGKIWLTSETGKGTTFFFTLTKKEAYHGLSTAQHTSR